MAEVRKVGEILSKIVAMGSPTDGPFGSPGGLRIVDELLRRLRNESGDWYLPLLYRTLIDHPPDKVYTKQKHAFWMKLMTTPLLVRFLICGMSGDMGYVPIWMRGGEYNVNPLIYNTNLRPSLVSYYFICGVYSPQDAPCVWNDGIGLTRRVLMHGGTIDYYSKNSKTRLLTAVLNNDCKKVEFLLAEGADPTILRGVRYYLRTMYCGKVNRKSKRRISYLIRARIIELGKWETHGWDSE